MTPDSDIDLLLVLETDDPRRVEKLADESVRDETCILQLLVATEADLAARAHKPYDVLYAALDEGVTLHDVRPPGDRVASPRRGEISASERLRDAGNWLEAAARRRRNQRTAFAAVWSSMPKRSAIALKVWPAWCRRAASAAINW